MFFKLALFIAAFLSSSLSSVENPIIKEELIPAPNYPKCFDAQASTILEVEPGVLIVAWDGMMSLGRCTCDNTHEGIWLSRYETDWDDDGIWSTPEEIAWAEKNRCWNPVLSKLPSGEILLFYQVGADVKRMVGMIKRSSDKGKTWSDAEALPPGFRGPVKNKPLITKDGKIICGASTENGATMDSFKTTSAWVEISKDGGYRFERCGSFEIPNQKYGVVEPALFSLKNEACMALFRDRANKIGQKGSVWQSFSTDDGKTWSPLKKTTLLNPDSSLDGIVLPNNKVLVVCNNSHTMPSSMSLICSTDFGSTFQKLFDIDISGESPAIIQAADGQIHVAYTWDNKKTHRRVIKHVVLNPHYFK